MNQSDESRVEAVPKADDAAREYVAARVKAGASRNAVVQELIQRGYATESASELVKPVVRQESRSARKSGLIMLVVGALLFVAGIATTVASYNAVSSTGGTYIIWYGLALLGIFLFGRGLVQLLRGRRVR